MEKEYNRKRHSKSNEFSGKQVYEDERILPFKSEIWLHLKTLICSNSKDTKTLEEILSCLRSIKSRDSEKGRIALDATYELFFAQYVLTTTNCDSNEGKENLTRILGVAVSRVVGHLQDMQASLENYRGASIQQTLQFFKIDIDIANYRNEFVHGTMPNLHILLDSIDKLTKLIIEVYWNFFDGDITWPKDVSDNDLKIISNIRKIIDLIQSPEVGLANYENFINENTVIQLRYSILKNCNLFIKLLMGTRNLIVIESVDIENNISENCNFTPKSYHIIVMNNILKLLSEDGDVFEFARYTGECAIEAEDDYFKKQYIYWTSWLIKKIVTGKLVCKWEIKELSKLCIILNLKECLEKIFEHYNMEVGDFVLSNQSENNKMDTDDDIKIVDISGPWGS